MIWAWIQVESPEYSGGVFLTICCSVIGVCVVNGAVRRTSQVLFQPLTIKYHFNFLSSVQAVETLRRAGCTLGCSILCVWMDIAAELRPLLLPGAACIDCSTSPCCVAPLCLRFFTQGLTLSTVLLRRVLKN